MTLDDIKNLTVKVAIEALQKGDLQVWKSLFTDDAILLDDGNPLDLVSFSEHAISHEHFTSIDRIENDGRDIYGAFHSDQWGDFSTYFKFHITSDGKIEKLEIGQV